MGMDITGVFRPMADRTNESFSSCGPAAGYEVTWHCTLSMQNPEMKCRTLGYYLHQLRQGGPHTHAFAVVVVRNVN
jgi:hypothetical protein